MSSPPLLALEDLVVEYAAPAAPLRAVDEVSLTLGAGETVGLIGESGSGKSTVALAVMGLLPQPQAQLRSGRIFFRGQDLLSLSEAQRRSLRGSQLSMVFQEPLSALNPVLRAGEQVAEVLRQQRQLGRRQARARVLELFQALAIPAPEERYRAFPHQLSGGMRQRVLLAMALACQPALLLADEPTSALDVTVQAQLLALLARVQAESGLGILFISHDLALVAQTCSRALVLYAGQVLESGPTARLIAAPRHPYTAQLVQAAQALRQPAQTRQAAQALRQPAQTRQAAQASSGSAHLAAGCRYQQACLACQADCRQSTPPLVADPDGSLLRCLHPLAPDQEPER